mmetsp:Transcript_13255/g.33682  ORF Transcript_13255/g.33682 Transcript_13255/m.33682 type:complete len:201 (-) Transcript_13255:864-1466(-)
MRRPSTRLSKVSSGTCNTITLLGTMNMRSMAFTCPPVRGKPSSNQPFCCASGFSSSCLSSSQISSSGTSSPASIFSLAACPTSLDSSAAAARSMSPVEMWKQPYCAFIASHCVPLPPAGGPEITILDLGLETHSVARSTWSVAVPAVVSAPPCHVLLSLAASSSGSASSGSTPTKTPSATTPLGSAHAPLPSAAPFLNTP